MDSPSCPIPLNIDMLDGASSPAIENGPETLLSFVVVRSINLTGRIGREAVGRVSFKSRRRPADLCAGSSTCSISGAERMDATSDLYVRCQKPIQRGSNKNITFPLRHPCLDRAAPDRIYRLGVLTNNSRTTGLHEIPRQPSFKFVKTIIAYNTERCLR